jgi:pimeloyl-ACP methyl ester carboxylesterase
MSAIVSADRRELARGRGAAACLLAALAAALGGCAWLDGKERTFMYRPTPGRSEPFAGLAAGDETSLIVVPGERPGAADQLAIWWLPSADPEAPTLLYLHGTFRNLYRNHPKIEALRAAGFGVLAVDYRGWGDSTPIVPSEKTIIADSEAAWTELVRRQPDPRKRVIFGHSLGGAVAIDLASRRHHGVDYGAIIVESTFPSLADLAGSAAGPLGPIAVWLSGERFDSLAKIGRIDAPILMLHGDRDSTVPVALGRRLRDAAPNGVRWVEIAGGTHSRLHTDAPDVYRQALESLIGALSAGP